MKSAACEACHGTGRRDLTNAERDTQAAVGKQWSATDAIGERLTTIQGYATKPTALCNRLVKMLAIGLVQRRAVSGKHYEWRLP